MQTQISFLSEDEGQGEERPPPDLFAEVSSKTIDKWVYKTWRGLMLHICQYEYHIGGFFRHMLCCFIKARCLPPLQETLKPPRCEFLFRVAPEDMCLYQKALGPPANQTSHAYTGTPTGAFQSGPPPKGPCTHIVDKKEPKQGHRNPFKAHVYTIQLHGPFGSLLGPT